MKTIHTKADTWTGSDILIITGAVPDAVIGIMIHIPDMDFFFILDTALKDITMVSDFTSAIDTIAHIGAIINPANLANNLILQMAWFTRRLTIYKPPVIGPR